MLTWVRFISIQRRIAIWFCGLHIDLKEWTHSACNWKVKHCKDLWLIFRSYFSISRQCIWTSLLHYCFISSVHIIFNTAVPVLLKSMFTVHFTFDICFHRALKLTRLQSTSLFEVRAYFPDLLEQFWKLKLQLLIYLAS